MKSLYGCERECGKPVITCDIDLSPLKKLMTPSFDMVLTQLYKLIDRILNIKLTGRINAIEGKLTGYAIIPVAIRVRIAWTQMYPGEYFDDTNPLQLGQIKDIYLSRGYDWRQDPFFTS